jgi:hypothetical protein
MRPQLRFAVIITVIFAVCGSARAQQIAPPGSGVTIDKMVIENGQAHTVKYIVKGGSPGLQALVRRVEWTENELSVVEQLQLLKLDTVVNERRVAAVRTAQLTNPYFPPGFIPPSIATDYACYGPSSLQRALTGQLAYEATPQAALQLIGFLEQQQTQLEAELKALPPQEKKAAQGPIDALRQRLAALPHDDVHSSAVSPKAPVAAPAAVPPTAPVAGVVAAPQAGSPGPAVPPMPLDQVVQQLVRQNQETLRQLIMPTQQPSSAAAAPLSDKAVTNSVTSAGSSDSFNTSNPDGPHQWPLSSTVVAQVPSILAMFPLAYLSARYLMQRLTAPSLS